MILNVVSRVLSLTTAKEGLSFLSFGSYSTGSQLNWITPKCFPQVFLGSCYFFPNFFPPSLSPPPLPPSTWVCMHARYVLRDQITWESIHFFHHRASWDWTQIIRVGSKFLYLLSLVCPWTLFNISLYQSVFEENLKSLPPFYIWFFFQKFNFLKFYMCVGVCV